MNRLVAVLAGVAITAWVALLGLNVMRGGDWTSSVLLTLGLLALLAIRWRER